MSDREQAVRRQIRQAEHCGDYRSASYAAYLGAQLLGQERLPYEELLEIALTTRASSHYLADKAKEHWTQGKYATAEAYFTAAWEILEHEPYSDDD